jgi:hypothetical protein
MTSQKFAEIGQELPGRTAGIMPAVFALAILLVADASLAARRSVQLGGASTRSSTHMSLTRARTHTAFLSDLNDPALARTLSAIFASVEDLVQKISTASCDSHSCFNTLGGDEQLAIDLVAYSVSARAHARASIGRAWQRSTYFQRAPQPGRTHRVVRTRPSRRR